MKQIILRSLIYILLIILCITLGVIGYKNKPLDKPNPDVMNIEFYRYNALTGNYDTLKINENNINYEGEYLDLNNCKTYKYNEETGIIKLDCNKAFRIVGYTEEALVINISKENLYFYKEKEQSYNGEFQRTYKMSITSYKQEGETALKEKEITIEDLPSLIKSNSLSYIYIKGNNCKDECTLFNKVFLNFSTKDNIYYLDSSKLKISDIKKLTDTYEDFPNTLQDYDNVTPQVYVVGNKKLETILEIEGKGFDYSKYNNFADNYEVENE